MLLLISGLLGELFVVGNNENGNLGIERTVSVVHNFTRVDIDPVQVAAAAETTAVLASDGRVYTAGHNVLGSLCVPTENAEYQDSFAPVPGLEPGDTVQIAASSKALLILLRNGSVRACGSNEDGRLSFFNVPDMEEHVLSEVGLPDGIFIK